MPQDADPRDTRIPNDPSSRETADRSTDNASIESVGITNRPIAEEQREQQNLPPRGERKADSKEDSGA